MAHGKNIQLFLMDGNARGRIKCSLANWTGVAYRIPRTDLEKCKDIELLKQSGVYFLFGISDTNDKPVVYVGQAGYRKNGEGILCRLQEHKHSTQKDYWTEAVAFTTSNNSFGPTEISYLENHFCKMATAAKRYVVKNENEPPLGTITEEKQSEMDEFIEYAALVMGTLGHNVFVPLAVTGNSDAENGGGSTTPLPQGERTLYISHKNKKLDKVIKATCQQTEEGFVVLKGSMISPITEPNVSVGQKAIREHAPKDENGILLEDMLFKSPSGAAVFVLGQSANGWDQWKDENGKTLHQLEDEEN